jgi:hypothetical protein
LPNIFLCGQLQSDWSKPILRIFNRVAKLNEATCPSTANCANENFADSCWNTVATGHTADTAGQFRVVLKYSGGCKVSLF